MMTSELIGCKVYDAEGQAVGTVHDLHFRLRVRPDGSQVCQLDALIFAGLLTILAYRLLRHEQDPLQDLTRPGTDGDVPGGMKPAPGSRDDS